MILAIETATPVCSVALWDSSVDQVFERRAEGRGVHSTKLLIFVHELLEERGLSIDDIQAVLISNGPGSFTGLRIGASALRGLLFNRKTPVLALATTLLIAASVYSYLNLSEGQHIHACIDARRTHLYHQQFKWNNQRLISLTDAALKSIDALADQYNEQDLWLGTGLNRLPQFSSTKSPTDAFEAISAIHAIRWLQSETKETGLNAYINQFGITADRLKVQYQPD